MGSKNKYLESLEGKIRKCIFIFKVNFSKTTVHNQIRRSEKMYFQEFIRKKSEAMRKNVNSERLLTLEFLREEGRQRYSLRDSTKF